MPITTVVFDVGETLVDETRLRGEWADWMGVPRLTFFAAMGAVIERGWHHRTAFQLVQPAFAFFHRLIEAAQRPVSEIAYVADRLGNDVPPAREVGLTAVFIRRGPWGHIQANRPEAARAHLILGSLSGLADALGGL